MPEQNQELVPVSQTTILNRSRRDLTQLIEAHLAQLLIQKKDDWTIMSNADRDKLVAKIDELKGYKEKLREEMAASKTKRKMNLQEFKQKSRELGEIETQLQKLPVENITPDQYFDAKKLMQEMQEKIQNQRQQKEQSENLLRETQQKLLHNQTLFNEKKVQINQLQNLLQDPNLVLQQRNEIEEKISQTQTELTSLASQLQNDHERFNLLSDTIPRYDQEIGRTGEELNQFNNIVHQPFTAPEKNTTEQNLKLIQDAATALHNQFYIRSQIPHRTDLLSKLTDALKREYNYDPDFPIENANVGWQSSKNQPFTNDTQGRYVHLSDPNHTFNRWSWSGRHNQEKKERQAFIEQHFPEIKDFINETRYVEGKPRKGMLTPYGFSKKIKEALKKREDEIQGLHNQYAQNEDILKSLKPQLEAQNIPFENLPRIGEYGSIRTQLFQLLKKRQEEEKNKETAKIRSDALMNQMQQMIQEREKFIQERSALENNLRNYNIRQQELNNALIQNQHKLNNPEFSEDQTLLQQNIQNIQNELQNLERATAHAQGELNTYNASLDANQRFLAQAEDEFQRRKPTLEQTIKNYELPAELDQRKIETQKRIQQLQNELDNTSDDGTEETARKIEKLEEEINELRAPYLLTAPLTPYFEKAAELVRNYTDSVPKNMAQSQAELELLKNKPRLDDLARPLMEKLTQDPLQASELFRKRADEEFVKKGLMEDHLRKYFGGKHLIDSQFGKQGLLNSAARHFAMRQHGATTDYKIRKAIGDFNLENDQKSYQNALARQAAYGNMMASLGANYKTQHDADWRSYLAKQEGKAVESNLVREGAALNSEINRAYQTQHQNEINARLAHSQRADAEHRANLGLAAQSLGAMQPASSEVNSMPLSPPPAPPMAPMGVSPALNLGLAQGVHNWFYGNKGAAYGGLQKYAEGGKVTPVGQDPYLPYTNEMENAARFMQSSKPNPNSDLFARLTQALAADPYSPTLNRIGDAILESSKAEKEDHYKHVENVGKSAEIYSALQMQKRLQSEFIKKHALDIDTLSETKRHNRATEAIQGDKSFDNARLELMKAQLEEEKRHNLATENRDVAKLLAKSSEVKLNPNDIKTLDQINKNARDAEKILGTLDELSTLEEATESGGKIAQLTQNPLILAAVGYGDRTKLDRRMMLQNKLVQDQLSSLTSRMGQGLLSLFSSTKPSSKTDKKANLALYKKARDYIVNMLNEDKKLLIAINSGHHVHEAQIDNPIYNYKPPEAQLRSEAMAQKDAEQAQKDQKNKIISFNSLQEASQG